jgi:S-DNA-T family DNA segregation ATPase FtsK/SpoIIIE
MYGRRDPYRQYRRHARRAWRHGNAPVLLVGTGEPVGVIAVAAISKWVYRHRSAFAPFLITAAEYTAAAYTHRHHPHYWIPVLVLTLMTAIVAGMPHRIMWAHPSMKFTAGLISRAWQACGVDRTPERIYATIVIAAGGGWLTAAIASGPAVKPLPAIAAIGTVVLGIPWWAHRRRRARVRAIRTMQAWPQLAENMGLPGSRISSIAADTWGWTGRVILRKGTTAAHAINQLPAIESGLGIRPGTARAVPDPARADRVILRVIENDPHADPIPWKEPESATITRPVDLGLFEDGASVLADILRRHVLIAGMTGAGKSVIVNVLDAALVKFADAEPWGIDLKGGMELAPWRANLRHLATTPEQATALLAFAVARLDQRAAQLAAQSLRVHEPTPAEPAIVIVIDEFSELPAEALELADSIARRGRAPAITLIAATQRPTQAAMGGTAIRSQMDVRICLRVRERRDTDLILGQGSLAAGWDAHALTLPGSFLLSDPDHTVPQRARARLITDAQVTAQSARYALPPAGDDPPAGRRPGPGRAEPPPDSRAVPGPHDDTSGPAGALWDALSAAGPDGAPIADLLAGTGMTRPTLYRHLAAHARAGRARQTGRGRWTAAPAFRPPARPGSPRRRSPRPDAP